MFLHYTYFNMFISSNYLSKSKVDILLRVLQMFTPNDSEQKHNPSQPLCHNP